MSFLTTLSFLIFCALVLVAGAVSWLAMEVRLIRCGKIAPKVLERISPDPDRYDTYNLDHQGGSARRPDYA